MRLLKKYVSNTIDNSMYESCSFGKQGVHAVFQMTCTIVNHTFLGVCTNKNIAQISLEKNIKSKDSAVYISSKKRFQSENMQHIRKKTPHGLTYQMTERV